jgi:FkbM family methyltransferase
MFSRLFNFKKRSGKGAVVRRFFGLDGMYLRGVAYYEGTPDLPLTVAMLDGEGGIIGTTLANLPCEHEGAPPQCGFSFPVPLAWLHYPEIEIPFSFRLVEPGIDFPKGGRKLAKRRLTKLIGQEDNAADCGLESLQHAINLIEPGRKVLILVVHELQRSGAPLIALSIARQLAAVQQCQVMTLCLGPSGPLAAEFAQLGQLATGMGSFLTREPKTAAKLLGSLVAHAHPAALVNSLCTAPLATALQSAGFKVISLLHEFPHAFGPTLVESMMAACEEIIFPCEEVRSHYAAAAAAQGKLTSILPQGAYQVEAGDAAGSTKSDGAAGRAYLKLPPQAEVVLACGTVDTRKGFDWFTSFAIHFSRYSPRGANTHFVWLGKISDRPLYFHGMLSLEANGMTDRFHHVGEMEDPTEAYATASLVMMCSRLDPYPSVVLEAMAMGRPVIGFDRGQGTSTLIDETGFGAVVPSMDMEASRLAIEEILGDRALRDRVAAEGPGLIRKRFRTADYAAAIAARLEKLGGQSLTNPAQAVEPTPATATKNNSGVVAPPTMLLQTPTSLGPPPPEWGSPAWKALVKRDVKALRDTLQKTTTVIQWQFPWGVVAAEVMATVPPQIEDIYLKDNYRFEPQGPVRRIIDGGGNVGLSALWFRKTFPDAEIIVYEPDTRLVAHIKANLAQADVQDVEVIPHALWLSDGTLNFAGDADDRGHLSQDGTHSVPTTDIAKAIGEGVDLLKLDIEGAEFACLEHLMETGAIRRVRAILAELHLNQANTDQALAVLAGLRTHGFALAYDSKIADWLGQEKAASPFKAVGKGKTYMQIYAWK